MLPEANFISYPTFFYWRTPKSYDFVASLTEEQSSYKILHACNNCVEGYSYLLESFSC